MATLTSGYKVLAPADIKKGQSLCNRNFPWGYVVAACKKTGVPLELGEVLIEDSSLESGPIYARSAGTAHRKAQKRIEGKLEGLGIGKFRQKSYVFTSRVARY